MEYEVVNQTLVTPDMEMKRLEIKERVVAQCTAENAQMVLSALRAAMTGYVYLRKIAVKGPDGNP